jgi:uncharacterized membrane protein YkoI
MPASAKLISNVLLPLLIAAALCVTPAAHATKKDLFGSEPTSQKAAATQTLNEQNADEVASQPETTTYETAATPAPEKNDQPSGLEKQWNRLKKNLGKAKKDLFGSEPAASKPTHPAPALIQEPSSSDAASSSSSQDNRPQISATEAAQRAQRTTEGQVMNVRKVRDEDRTLYNVNLLQKNGRMKTVNIDAYSGEVVEEAPQ